MYQVLRSKLQTARNLIAYHRAQLSQLSQVVTASSIMEDRLLSWGVPREKTVRIPIGVDTRLFLPPSADQRDAAKKRLGIALVTNPDGEVLNGAAIYMASVSGFEQGLVATAIDGTSTASVPYSSLSKPVRHFMHRENFLIYIGAHDDRYQSGLSGPRRYLAKLYRFIFEPQQYFGYTHFTSFYWLRGLSLFLGLIFGLAALAIYLTRLAHAGRRARTT